MVSVQLASSSSRSWDVGPGSAEKTSICRPRSDARSMLWNVRSRSPTIGWWMLLSAGAVFTDVVGTPELAEQVAAGGEFADEIAELPVVR